LPDSIARPIGATLEPVEVKAGDGAVLSAWLFTPARPNGSAVILLHGVGDARSGSLSAAGFLLRAGFTDLTPDCRGHGVSGGGVISYEVREATSAPGPIGFSIAARSSGPAVGESCPRQDDHENGMSGVGVLRPNAYMHAEWRRINLTAGQIQDFLKGSERVSFAGPNKTEVYAWVQGTLVAQEYTQHDKKQRGTIRAFVEKAPGWTARRSPGYFARDINSSNAARWPPMSFGGQPRAYSGLRV